MKLSRKKHEEKARKAYHTHRTKGNLRWWMIWKARRGHFDHRMFHYYAGIPENVTRRVKVGVRRAIAHSLVITATRNGVHAVHSFHSSGRAFDAGLIERLIGTRRGRRALVRFQRSEFNEWRRGKRPHLVELIGPDNNMVVLQGRHSPLREGDPLENQHDNHVHEAYV